MGIDYDLLWENQTINAQAWILGDSRHVTVCGGLVRHPAMTACGIALMLAHETGHHLGGPPVSGKPITENLVGEGGAKRTP